MMKNVRVSHERTEPRGKIGVTRGQALLILLACFVIFYFLTGFIFVDARVDKRDFVSYKLVTVQPGDSLWKLADRYQDEAGIERDVLLLAIKEANQLSSALIYPGDNLLIPLGK